MEDDEWPRELPPAVFAPEGLNGRVTHGGSAAFLTGPGLPRYAGFFWHAAQTEDGGPADAGDLDGHDGAPEGAADRWVGLGWLTAMGDEPVYLDGGTGTLWVGREDAGVLQPLNGSLAAFARFLAAFHRDWRHIEPGREYDVLHAAADNLMMELRPVDPGAFADPAGSWWYDLLGHIPTWY